MIAIRTTLHDGAGTAEVDGGVKAADGWPVRQTHQVVQPFLRTDFLCKFRHGAFGDPEFCHIAGPVVRIFKALPD